MKRWVLVLASLLLWLQTAALSQAAPVSSPAPKVLILYSAETEAQMTEVRILDSILGHFTKDITVTDETQFQQAKAGAYTHVFYMGLRKDELSEETIAYLDSFPGVLFFIGYNTEQLPTRYSFVAVGGDVNATSASYPAKGWNWEIMNEGGKASTYSLFSTTIDPAATVILQADSPGEAGKPLLVQKEQSYYMASVHLDGANGQLLGEALFPVFGKVPAKGHSAYLRLEDVRPGSDPKVLRDIADYLKEQNIPYLVSLIPVNADTGQHLSDVPRLVEVLRYMQEHGGSIVQHGYTHQYHADEKTGEGYEFWDYKHGSPIFQEESKNTPLKQKESFADTAAYNQYVQRGQAFEEAYTKERVEKGIRELVASGIYPLAFEAPHYAMSQRGYQVVSQYFSTYAGQVQISNEDAESSYAPSFATSPSFLHGMQLLPETIGFYDTELTAKGIDPIPRMIAEAKRQIQLSDGYVGAFYHPNLGLEKLLVLVKELKKLPGLNWVDLKKQQNSVKASGIEVQSGKDGIQSKEDNLFLKEKIKYGLFEVQSIFSKLIITVAGAAVLLFAASLGYISWKKRGSAHG